MKRLLLMLAMMAGICVFSLADRPASASAPLCSPAVCKGNFTTQCTCPPGTKIAGEEADCGTWHADCNLL
jgi:hypothetical protein